MFHDVHTVPAWLHVGQVRACGRTSRCRPDASEPAHPHIYLMMMVDLEKFIVTLWCSGLPDCHPNDAPLHPSTPPQPLPAPTATPPSRGPVYSEQTERGGLAQTAVLCRKHCPGPTLAARGGLISSTQLFPFVTVDCG